MRKCAVRKRILGAWFAFHFTCLIAVSLYETGRLIALSPTIIPSKIKDTVQRFGVLLEAPLGLRFAESNPIRQSLVSYLAFAGADGGYGYFAPGIPDTYELTFELYYPDGRTEMQVARLSNSALGLRIASLLEQIGGGPSPKLREHMLKKFARVVWRQHPQVKKMRVSIWQVTLPTDRGICSRRTARAGTSLRLRFQLVCKAAAEAAMTRFEKMRNVIASFFFSEESDSWLGVLRIGLGLVIVCYAVSLVNDWNFLFATSGSALVTRDFSEALLSLQSRFVPRLGWLVDVGERFGLKEQVFSG